jgi:hypothetical protein
MSQPNLNNWQDAAYGVSDYSASGIVANASNIRFGDNPAYGIADFIAIYPQFGTVAEDGNFTGVIPQAVLQMFINLASSCIQQVRYFDLWPFAMALFVAHYATLYLQASTPTGANAKAVAQAGMAKGVQVSKGVGDASTSYQSLVAGWESWGSWNLTTFGQQLITQASIVGMGGMYIR